MMDIRIIAIGDFFEVAELSSAKIFATKGFGN